MQNRMVGISHTAGDRYGKERYRKLKAIGFDCLDYNLMNAETLFFSDAQEKRDAYILKEKKLIAEAGLVVNQVHGPWRFPIYDGTKEQRAERMEKMVNTSYYK